LQQILLGKEIRDQIDGRQLNYQRERERVTDLASFLPDKRGHSCHEAEQQQPSARHGGSDTCSLNMEWKFVFSELQKKRKRAGMEQLKQCEVASKAPPPLPTQVLFLTCGDALFAL
jgi:hypothetical protein